MAVMKKSVRKKLSKYLERLVKKHGAEMTLALVTGIVSSLAADQQAKADRKTKAGKGPRPAGQADKRAKAEKVRPEKGKARPDRRTSRTSGSGPQGGKGARKPAVVVPQAHLTGGRKEANGSQTREDGAGIGRPGAGRHRRSTGPRRRRPGGEVQADGGVVLATYREPFGGTPVLFTALPSIGSSRRPSSAILASARQAADGRVREARTLPRSDHRDPPGRRLLDAERNHRLQALRKLGAKTVTALLVPDPEVAFKILALNTEKAHNLKEKSLETIRMERALAESTPQRRERDFAFEFDQPAFLTLGAAYEKRPRLSGGAYNSMLRRIEDFLDEAVRRRCASASGGQRACSRWTTTSAASSRS
jgi:hypothetical protein